MTVVWTADQLFRAEQSLRLVFMNSCSIRQSTLRQEVLLHRGRHSLTKFQSGLESTIQMTITMCLFLLALGVSRRTVAVNGHCESVLKIMQLENTPYSPWLASDQIGKNNTPITRNVAVTM